MSILFLLNLKVLNPKNKKNWLHIWTSFKSQLVNILRVTKFALKSKLEREKVELTSLIQREEMTLIAIFSLEAEMERIIEEKNKSL